MQAQVLEAKLNWFRQGDLTSFLAPLPRDECEGANLTIYGVQQTMREHNCVTINASLSHGALNYLATSRVPIRERICNGPPIWDFGKISAGVGAAEAGVKVSTGGRPARADRS